MSYGTPTEEDFQKVWKTTVVHASTGASAEITMQFMTPESSPDTAFQEIIDLFDGAAGWNLGGDAQKRYFVHEDVTPT